MRPGYFRFGNYGPVGESRASLLRHALAKLAPKLASVDPRFALDHFHLFYLLLPDAREPGPGERDSYLETVRDYFAGLLDREDVAKARKATMGDEDLSLLSAAVFLAGMAEKLAEAEPRLAALAGRPGKGGKLSAGALARAAGEALMAVKKAVAVGKELKEIGGLAAGRGHVLTFGDWLERAARLARLADVEKVLALLKKVEASLSVSEEERGRPARFGTLSSLTFLKSLENLPRAVASDLAVDDILFEYRLAAGLLRVWEFREPASGRDVLVLADKSGSMKSPEEKTVWSRALLLALLKRTLRRGGEFRLRFFDDQPHEALDTRSTPLLDIVERILRVEAEGGTDITKAMRAAEEDARGGETIVLVTDGEDRIPEDAPVVDVAIMVLGHNESLRKHSKHYLSAKLTEDEILRVVEYAEESVPA